MNDLKEGQTIYLKPINNAARYNQDIKEVKISKVGRKYFETFGYGKFFIDTLKQNNGNYLPNYVAYTNNQDILDENECLEIYSFIDRYFRYDWGGLSLEKMRQIKDIIQSEK